MLPKRLRLWGIGGVGMSALAEHYHKLGHLVTGYDREPSPQTERLMRMGISIDYEPREGRLGEVEAIIYTPAIPETFPERRWALERGLPLYRRAEALAMAVASYEVLAVAGAHGKTSTAAILAWLLRGVGASPTAFVGGLMRNFDSTYVAGVGPYAVVEADEYDRAMLRLKPAHGIILSTEPDHLEIYGSPQGVLEAYQAFAHQIEGLCVVGPTVSSLGRPVLSYRLISYEVVSLGQMRFEYEWSGGRRAVSWPILGRVYAENAAAALVLLEAMGFSFSDLAKALAEFRGVSRRMEWQLVASDRVAILDYAHHPTEIRRTIEAIRESFPGWQVVVFFQPHLYSRTAFFAKEFALALDLADAVVLLPIYAAREPFTPEISSELIFQHMRGSAQLVLDLQGEMKKLDKMLKRPSVVVLMGAGDIYRGWELLLKYLRSV